MATLGTGMSVYYALNKLNNVSPRLKVLASLVAMGATAGNRIYNTTLENAVGFNRLMVGITDYNRTGI
jgi:hypothetical protein